jgi:hypothetical protein
MLIDRNTVTSALVGMARGEDIEQCWLVMGTECDIVFWNLKRSGGSNYVDYPPPLPLTPSASKQGKLLPWLVLSRLQTTGSTASL